MNKEDKSTVFDIFEESGFHSITHNRGLNSARKKDALYQLPKSIAKIRNYLLSLPQIVNEESDEDSGGLQGQGNEKIFKPSNIINIWTKLEVLLGLKLTSNIDALTEASDLIDKSIKKDEMQNEWQYRSALNKYSSQ